MTLTAIILLILLGLLLLVLEVLIVPGFVVGVIGGVLVITGISMAYYSFGNNIGNIVLGSTVLTSFITGILVFRSGTWNKASLHTSLSGKVNTIEQGKIKTGDIGTTISRIAPMGKALFNDIEYEVSSQEAFINENTAVKIMKIDHNKVYIKPV